MASKLFHIKYPPFPDIFHRKWNIQYDTLDEEISAFLTDQNSTEFDSLTPFETTTQNIETSTTLIVNYLIPILQEYINLDGNRAETNTNDQETDKKINNDGSILITQPEDAGITDSIDNLIVDEESTTTTTPKLQASSSSTTGSDHTTTTTTKYTTKTENTTTPTTTPISSTSTSTLKTIIPPI